MNHLSRCLISLVGFAALAPTSALAASSTTSSKLSQDVTTTQPWQTVPVIIQYTSAPTTAQNFVIAALGGTVTGVLNTINAVVATLPGALLPILAADPNVSYISRDHTLGAKQVTVTTAEYTTEPINAPHVWSQGYDGTGVSVAIIDSGITPVDDLSAKVKRTLSGNRIVYSQSFVPGDLSTNDVYGHGTHVAGLVAGNATDSTGANFFRTFSGAAPNANLINLRVLDKNGAGSDSAVIAAIGTAILLKPIYNIRVINLSLGRPIYDSYKVDPLCKAVEAAWKAGIVVVAAAGNDGRDLALNPEGYGTIEAPGNDPYVLTVGAMRTMGTAGIGDDLIASYSSKGPSFIDHIVKPDIVAPGNLVSSLKFSGDLLAIDNPSFATLNSFYINGGTSQPSAYYFPLSGTSMATGVASGAVALLAQAVPNATPDQIKAYLMQTANKSNFPATSSVTDPASGTIYKANYDVFTVGAGYMDVAAALNSLGAKGALEVKGTAMSPVASGSASNTSFAADPSAVWGSTILWGASSVYGTNAVTNGSTILWGASVLAGSNDPQGFTVLWGANSPWAQSSPSAQTILWGATDTQGSTILWGASSPTSSTILWGASGTQSSTILWGASGDQSSTILWGASTPYTY
jgi:serine protease AprX